MKFIEKQPHILGQCFSKYNWEKNMFPNSRWRLKHMFPWPLEGMGVSRRYHYSKQAFGVILTLTEIWESPFGKRWLLWLFKHPKHNFFFSVFATVHLSSGKDFTFNHSRVLWKQGLGIKNLEYMKYFRTR